MVDISPLVANQTRVSAKTHTKLFSDISWERGLQIALGFIWFLDAGLQFQSFMFTKAFTGVLSATASGDPRFAAQPILDVASFLSHHIALYNTAFALIQLAIALGILYKPTLKLALGISFVWVLAVWWLGEGLGGIANGGSPVSGVPGAVLLYGLIAVLLWPHPESNLKKHPTLSKSLWVLLWSSFVYFSLRENNRSPHALKSMIAGMESGEPSWIKTIDRLFASSIGSHGLEVSIGLAVVFAVIAIGMTFPQFIKPTIFVAIVASIVIWLLEDFGGIFTGQGTDPNTGPLLVLLALCYWPRSIDLRDSFNSDTL